jgi:hypothetical protein
MWGREDINIHPAVRCFQNLWSRPPLAFFAIFSHFAKALTPVARIPGKRDLVCPRPQHDRPKGTSEIWARKFLFNIDLRVSPA